MLGTSYYYNSCSPVPGGCRGGARSTHEPDCIYVYTRVH